MVLFDIVVDESVDKRGLNVGSGGDRQFSIFTAYLMEISRSGTQEPEEKDPEQPETDKSSFKFLRV